MVDTPFSIAMRELAVSGHERGDELLDQADAFDAAVANPDLTARELAREWARCHRLWEACTGESAFAGIAEKAAKLAAVLVLQRGHRG